MKIKRLILAGVVLVIIGAIISIIGFWQSGFRLEALNNENMVEQNKNFESTDNLDIEMTNSNIIIYVSTEATDISIKYYESDYTKYSFTENNETLIIEQDSHPKPWFKYVFNFQFYSYKMEITIPSALYSNININGTSGNIELHDVEAEKLNIGITSVNCYLYDLDINSKANIKGTTGNAKIYDSKFVSLDVNYTTGNIHVNDSNIEEGTFKLTSGNCNFNNTVFEEVKASTTTGNINSTSLDSKESQFTTTTGNVKVNLTGTIDDYKILINKTTGSSNVGSKLTGERYLDIKVTTGNIRVSFD